MEHGAHEQAGWALTRRGELQKRIEGLRAARSAMLELVERDIPRTGQTSPVFRLPLELWTEIIVLAIAAPDVERSGEVQCHETSPGASGLPSEEVRGARRSWFVWNEVSVEWYRRFRDNPGVWATDFRHTGHWTLWPKTMVESEALRPLKKVEAFVGEHFGLELPMEFVDDYHHQICELSVVAFDRSSLARVLDHPFVRLSRLTIRQGTLPLPSDDPGDYACIEIDSHVGPLDRITALELQGVVLPIELLRHCSSLTRVAVDWFQDTPLGRSYSGPHSIRNLLPALSRHPITEIAVRAYLAPDPDLRPPVTLPHLRSLEVAGPEDGVRSLLDAIAAPALERLAVDLEMTAEDVDRAAALAAVRRASEMLPPLHGEVAKFSLTRDEHDEHVLARVDVRQVSSASDQGRPRDPLTITFRDGGWPDVQMASVLLESVRGRPVDHFVYVERDAPTATDAAPWYAILHLSRHAKQVELGFRGDPEQYANAVECLGLFQVLGRLPGKACHWTLRESTPPAEDAWAVPWPRVEEIKVTGGPSLPELASLLNWLSRRETRSGQRPTVRLTLEGKWAEGLLVLREKFREAALLDWRVTPLGRRHSMTSF